jgi:hypothetical protein
VAADAGNVARGVIAAAVLALTIGGCGAGADDAPVRALMQRYLHAMIAQDWTTACAQLTPEAAELRHRSAPRTDCASALAFEAGGGLSNPPPYAHPERAGEEFKDVRIQTIEMRDDSAQVYVESPRGEEFILLAVRRAGRWLLAQDLEVGIPIDQFSTPS